MNAKKEFLEHTADKKVKCAIIQIEDYENDAYDEKGFWTGNAKITKGALRVGYTDKDYSDFLESINFEYNGGYGGQELFGYVWFEDGTWLERGEYDGSEWWEHKVLPVIPKELIN